MALTKTEIEILETIQSKLKRGDITAIAEKLRLTPEYIGMVLNPKCDRFNEGIVGIAIELISIREQSRKKQLESISDIPDSVGEGKNNTPSPEMQELAKI